MDDDFLTRYYQAPPRAFSRELYERLAREENSPFDGRQLIRNALFVLASILLIVACVRASSSVVLRYDKIGDIWVDVNHNVKKSALDASMSPILIRYAAQEQVDLPQAEQAFGATIKLPIWAPQQFTPDSTIALDEDVKGGTPHDGRVYWAASGDPHKLILLFITDTRGWTMEFGRMMQIVWEPTTSTVVSGSYREVKVHGQPAVLVQGDWTWPGKPGLPDLNAPATWDSSAGYSLYWTDSDMFYELYTASRAVSPQDLIRMAESAQ
jgi:hypothetical protein